MLDKLAEVYLNFKMFSLPETNEIEEKSFKYLEETVVSSLQNIENSFFINTQETYKIEYKNKINLIQQKINKYLKTKDLKEQINVLLIILKDIENLFIFKKEFNDKENISTLKLESGLIVIDLVFLYLQNCFRRENIANLANPEDYIKSSLEGLEVFSNGLSIYANSLYIISEDKIKIMILYLDQLIKNTNTIINLPSQYISQELNLESLKSLKLIYSCLYILKEVQQKKEGIINPFFVELKALIQQNDFSTNEDQEYIYSGVSWENYEKISDTIGDGSWCRTSYLDGLLKIMSPGLNHERIKSFLASVIETYCFEKDIKCFPIASTTLRNKINGLKGKEPDASFAIKNDKKIPDIAIEVNFTSGSEVDLEIYAGIGVTEVWIWDRKNNLKFYILENNRYIETNKSTILEGFPLEIVHQTVNTMKAKDLNEGKRQLISFLNS